MKISIQCFGTYRNFAPQLSVTLPAGALVQDLRDPVMAELQKIDESFDDLALLQRSKFATETDLLIEGAALSDGMELAIIPPVSGG